MRNIQIYLFPKSLSHCFLVLCSFFLFFFACTTTESDQNGDQLTRRMTEGRGVPYKVSFYARVYSLRTTFAKKPIKSPPKKQSNKKLGTEVTRTCAGAFIAFDFVLTALTCVDFDTKEDDVYGVWYKRVVQRGDFSKLQVGLIEEKHIANVVRIFANPQDEKDRWWNAVYDFAVLQTDGSYGSYFLPLKPCFGKSISQNLRLRMIGMTKTEKNKFTIKPTINNTKQEFSFYSGFFQEAPFRKLTMGDDVPRFDYHFKGRMMTVHWNRMESFRSHRYLVFSEEGARMDEREIGSPAFLYNLEKRKPECLFGVLSGFRYGQQAQEQRGIRKNQKVVQALELEHIYTYRSWLPDLVKLRKKFWEAKDDNKTGKTAPGLERQGIHPQTHQVLVIPLK